MNIDDFRYITTIAELGSFTNAAKKLFIAQPSLSQRVKHIEDIYNIIIFIRDSKKGIYLTEEGELFVRYARKILQADDDLRKELEDVHKKTGNLLKIGISQLINSALFDQIVRRFHEKNPDVHFEFVQRTTAETQQILANGEIDIGIVYPPILYENLEHRIILDDRMVLIPAKESSLAEKIARAGIEPGSCVDVSLLDGEVFASNAEGMRIFEFIRNLPEKYGVKPDIQHFSKNYHSLYSIARAGIASTILMESFFIPGQEHEPYYYLDCEETNLSIAVVWRKNAYLTKTSKDLIEIAQDVSYEIENT